VKDKYQIRLTARNEGIEYRDAVGVYRFNVMLKGKEWTLLIPGSRGNNYERYELSEEEKSLILPRIIDYLQSIKWFGLFRRSYSVRVTDRH
jgi:hypothetical protein